MRLSFTPTVEPLESARRLDLLLISGPIGDPDLARRIDRLAGAFQNYASCYPLPLWAPGLVITPEMRGLTEALFPIARVRSAFDQLLGRGCRFPPLLTGSYLHSSASWLDLLQRLRPQLSHANPATTLSELAKDPETRTRFLFALLLPQHFGGAFDRYPGQSEWLGAWLKINFDRLGGRIRALDSACGSGEGTYGLAELIDGAGFSGKGSAVHGSTLEPIELFAGAHAYFPHDLGRARDYRARIAPILERADGIEMEFYLEEVGAAAEGEEYQLILCNGLLGGPLLHEPGELSAAVGSLASRLAPGGVLLAADRFHAGWRQRVPVQALRALMRENGLSPLEVPEGIAGEKTASGIRRRLPQSVS